MPVNRFWICQSLNQPSITLEKEEFFHLHKVLRLQKEDSIEIVNGRGELAQGKIESIEKDKALITLFQYDKAPVPSPIVLFQPLLQLTKLEWIVEKCTELGVTTFVFYPAQRGELKELSPSKQERLQRIMQAGVKQSGNLWMPEIKITLPIEKWEKSSLSLYVALPESTLYLSSFSPLSPEKGIGFLIGPEAGFSEKEKEHLQKLDAIAFRLSPYILRTETASITAISQAICLRK